MAFTDNRIDNSTDDDRPKFALPDRDGRMQVVTFEQWCDADAIIVQVAPGSSWRDPAMIGRKRLFTPKSP